MLCGLFFIFALFFFFPYLFILLLRLEPRVLHISSVQTLLLNNTPSHHFIHDGIKSSASFLNVIMLKTCSVSSVGLEVFVVVLSQGLTTE